MVLPSTLHDAGRQKLTCYNGIGSEAGGPSNSKRAQREEDEGEHTQQAAGEAASLQKKDEMAKNRVEKNAKKKGGRTRTKTGVSFRPSGEKGNDIHVSSVM